MSGRLKYFGLTLLVCSVFIYIGGFLEARINPSVSSASIKHRIHQQNRTVQHVEVNDTLYNSFEEELKLDKFNRSKSQGMLQEKQHIAFLKVHKAASTTLQTMFFRFGYERNLSFVLPVKGNYFSHSSKVHADILSPRYGDHYDIICNHGIFNHTIYSSLMPNDTVYLAVVRDPLDQFISAVKYYTEVYSMGYLINIPGNRIANLIEYPNLLDRPLSYSRNSMSRDFGFKNQHVVKHAMKEDAKCYLKKLDKLFDFVLIAEHFDESLILMRRLLNWSLKDILYISKNVRGTKEVINERLKRKFKKRNELDYLLYDYFYRKFKIILKEFEEDVIAETAHFKNMLITVQNWCSNVTVGQLPIETSIWNEKFFIQKGDCNLMVKHEFNFINLLKGN